MNIDNELKEIEEEFKDGFCELKSADHTSYEGVREDTNVNLIWNFFEAKIRKLVEDRDVEIRKCPHIITFKADNVVSCWCSDCDDTDEFIPEAIN